jgi:hypothetical protein
MGCPLYGQASLRVILPGICSVGDDRQCRMRVGVVAHAVAATLATLSSHPHMAELIMETPGDIGVQALLHLLKIREAEHATGPYSMVPCSNPCVPKRMDAHCGFYPFT